MFKSDGGSEGFVGSKRKRVNGGNDRWQWVLSGKCKNEEVMGGASGRRRSDKCKKSRTHPLNDIFSRTTWVSWYQKGKTKLGLNEPRDDRVLWSQWHQLDHMQTICTSLETDNHTNTSSLNVYRPDALPDAQPTVSKHWKHEEHKQLSYRRVTARCVLSVGILPITTQQCRNYLYDKSWPNRWYEVGDLVGGNVSWTNRRR